jgi:cyclophilin family peptidyl-prolyl cis-trans isomerase
MSTPVELRRLGLFLLLGVGVPLLLVVPCLRVDHPQAPEATATAAATEAPAAPTGENGPCVEGKAIVTEITGGPFDLHRKYRSMEGPWTGLDAKVCDLVASPHINLPEGTVQFAENGGAAASMFAPSNSALLPKDTQGLVAGNPKQELYWFKGIKLEVLDENDKLLPTAEFICHFNLDVDIEPRNEAFPEGERCNNTRLSSLSQGLTTMMLPDGYAVPVSSQESFHFSFQAANRTSSVHRRVKHKCTIYFIKDSDLVFPVTALHWYVPYITVVVDRHSPSGLLAEKKNCPACVGSSRGVNAPNNVVGGTFEDDSKQVVTGHWVVPPGVHSWYGPITDERDFGFAAKTRRIIAAWTHIHPLCTSFSLVRADTPARPKVFTTHVKTSFHDDGFEIEHIDYFTPRDGIEMQGGVPYELEVTYDNNTKGATDSMAAVGIFFADDTFVRPRWAMPDAMTASCGIAHCDVDKDKHEEPKAAAVAAAPELPPYPLFDDAKDGPLLTTAKTVEVATTAGNLRLQLDPALAPRHATQVYKLLTNGVFDGTDFFRYERNFVLQTSLADGKADGYPPLPAAGLALVRRIPLEVDLQKKGSLAHAKWLLSMARDDAFPDSATMSFSLMLGSAHHLDGKFSIFGRILQDDATVATLDRIIKEWPKHPVILHAKDIETEKNGKP